ncbi:MAG TPA: trigger factor, partial [Candidatus Paceibacterota bacterium]
ALALIAKSIKIDGFREGKVPTKIALERVGEMAVLEEAVELAIRDFYPECALAKKLDVVGRPDIRITKIALGTPVSLTIRTAVYPAIEVPKNWKKLAQDVPAETPAEVSDEEVMKTLESLRTHRKSTDAETGAETLPEIDDAFAKSIGAFDTLDALKDAVKKGVAEEKAREAKDKRRGAIIDALVEKTKIDVPRIFVESELEKIMGQIKDDIARIGMKFEDYLAHAKKTEAEIREGFKEQARKRAILQLLLNELATAEKIEPDAEAVEAEMKHALEHFPDANREALRIHIQTILRNEKVLTMLEN